MEVTVVASSSTTTSCVTQNLHAADLQDTVWGMLVHLSSMVILVASGLLASIGGEEENAFLNKFAKSQTCKVCFSVHITPFSLSHVQNLTQFLAKKLGE